jgi:hypothetical protein
MWRQRLVRTAYWLVVAVVGLWLLPRPGAAQPVTVIAEQWLQGYNSSGFFSASLDPGRRYGLQVIPVGDSAPFRGTYTQNWFLRDGSRRAGSSDGTLHGRAPWEQELPPPAPGLAQWTFAAGFWNEGSGTLVVRLLDLGPR